MKIKHFLSFFVLFMSLQLVAQKGFEDLEVEEQENVSLNWFTDFEAAKLEAKNQKKPLLLFFTGSDWCAPCKMLKEDFFNTKAFKAKSEHMILVLVDMPRRIDVITPEQKEKNKQLVAKYNQEGSYPNVVGLTQNLEVVGQLSGYTLLRETDNHFQFIDSLIANYSNTKQE